MSIPSTTALPGGGMLRADHSGGISGDASFECTCGENIVIYIYKEWPKAYSYQWEINHYEEEMRFEQTELCEKDVFIKLAKLLDATNCKILGVTDGV